MAIRTLEPIRSSKSLPVVDSSWQGWIVENIARGCGHEGMIQVMLDRGFDREQADHAITRMRTFQYVSHEWMHGKTIQTNDRLVDILEARFEPNIAVLGNVLSDEECDEIIRRSTSKLCRSTTVDNATGMTQVIEERTSDSAYHQPIDEFIRRIDQRCSDIMGIPVSHGENLQVVRYKQGGEYRPHFDYFVPQAAGSAVQMRCGGQRVSTLILYLNDVVDGGATAFPSIDFKMAPKKGSGLYFSYTNAHGQVDPLTLHAGEPLGSGEKWICTKWMRQVPRL